MLLACDGLMLCFMDDDDAVCSMLFVCCFNKSLLTRSLRARVSLLNCINGIIVVDCRSFGEPQGHVKEGHVRPSPCRLLIGCFQGAPWLSLAG